VDALPRIADRLLAVWIRIISLSAETYALVLVSAIAVISLRRESEETDKKREKEKEIWSLLCLDFPLYS